MQKDSQKTIETRLDSIETSLKSLSRIENTLENFAISVKEQFDRVDEKLDKIDSEKADKEDIARIDKHLFGHENRLLRLEDGMQIVRGKLKFEN